MPPYERTCSSLNRVTVLFNPWTAESRTQKFSNVHNNSYNNCFSSTWKRLSVNDGYKTLIYTFTPFCIFTLFSLGSIRAKPISYSTDWRRSQSYKKHSRRWIIWWNNPVTPATSTFWACIYKQSGLRGLIEAQGLVLVKKRKKKTTWVYVYQLLWFFIWRLWPLVWKIWLHSVW